jgi:hypothetical protein
MMPSARPETLVTYLRYWLLFGLLLGGLAGLQLVIASGNIALGLLLLAFGVAIGVVGALLKYAWDRRHGFPSRERHVDRLGTVFGLLGAVAAASSGFVRAFDGPTWISLPLLGAAFLFVVITMRRGGQSDG